MLTDRQGKSLRTDQPQIEVYDGSSPGKHNAAVREDVGFSFNHHDLCRAASTHLVRLGVWDEIRQAVLNHRQEGPPRRIQPIRVRPAETGEVGTVDRRCDVSRGQARPILRGGSLIPGLRPWCAAPRWREPDCLVPAILK